MNPDLDERGKPILKPFMQTEGKNILKLLQELSIKRADKPLPVLNKHQEKQLLNKSNNVDTRKQLLNDLVDDGNDNKQINVSNHVEKEFESQSSKYDEIIQDEIKEYKGTFDTLTKKITTQENLIQSILNKYNNSDDLDEKISLKQEIDKEMNNLLSLVKNFGKSINNSDQNDVVDVLSNYDNNYDEETKRTIIKNI